MSELFAYICVKTTADFVVPISAPSQPEFNRKVVNAFRGLVGGVLRVGDIKFRPTEGSVANHLLCDGSTITRSQFPELVEYLNPGEDSATLPDYSGGLTITTPTVTQTVDDSGTVSTGGTVEGAGTVGGTTGGNIVTGGRIRQSIRFDEDLP